MEEKSFEKFDELYLLTNNSSTDDEEIKNMSEEQLNNYVDKLLEMGDVSSGNFIIKYDYFNINRYRF